MIQPEIKKEDSLHSITQNCETLIKQTHRNPDETLEYKFSQPRETLLLNPLISFEGSWMTGLMNRDGYSPIFNITEGNNKFELNTDTFHEL